MIVPPSSRIERLGAEMAKHVDDMQPHVTSRALLGTPSVRMRHTPETDGGRPMADGIMACGSIAAAATAATPWCAGYSLFRIDMAVMAALRFATGQHPSSLRLAVKAWMPRATLPP